MRAPATAPRLSQSGHARPSGAVRLGIPPRACALVAQPEPRTGRSARTPASASAGASAGAIGRAKRCRLAGERVRVGRRINRLDARQSGGASRLRRNVAPDDVAAVVVTDGCRANRQQFCPITGRPATATRVRPRGAGCCEVSAAPPSRGCQLYALERIFIHSNISRIKKNDEYGGSNAQDRVSSSHLLYFYESTTPVRHPGTHRPRGAPQPGGGAARLHRKDSTHAGDHLARHPVSAIKRPATAPTSGRASTPPAPAGAHGARARRVEGFLHRVERVQQLVVLRTGRGRRRWRRSTGPSSPNRRHHCRRRHHSGHRATASARPPS